MSDVFAITVPIGAQYASVNHVGAGSHRGGKKSLAYKRLFADVKGAAEAEIARTGWTTASCSCFAMIVRYLGDRRRHDAMNLGKCEFDALTAAGASEDDHLAGPCMPWVRFDGQGEHRAAIVVVKLYQSVVESVPIASRERGFVSSRERAASASAQAALLETGRSDSRWLRDFERGARDTRWRAKRRPVSPSRCRMGRAQEERSDD